MTIPKAGLMVVDMQEDFCEPNGSLAIKGGRELAPVINELLDMPGFAVKVASRDFHPKGHISFASSHPDAKPYTSSHTIKNPENEEETQTTLLWPDHCVQDTKGCEIIPELHSHKLTHVVKKGMDNRTESYSAFGPPFRNPKVGLTELDGILKEAGITHLFCVGVAYDFCVMSTAIDAVEYGYKTFVIENGTRVGVHGDEALAATRKKLQDGGVKIIGMDAEELIMARGSYTAMKNL